MATWKRVISAGETLSDLGGGSGSTFLRKDGTWATPTDTNTTYSVGDGGLTQKNFTTTLKNKLDGIASSADNYGSWTLAAGNTNTVASGKSVSISGSGATSVGQSVSSGNHTITISSTNTTYSVGDGGLTQKNFTTTLKSKLDGIASSADNYSSWTIKSSAFDGGGAIASGNSLIIQGAGSVSASRSGKTLTLTGTDTNTTYSAGSGLDLSGTTFSVGEDSVSEDMLESGSVSQSKIATNNSATSGHFLQASSGGHGQQWTAVNNGYTTAESRIAKKVAFQWSCRWYMRYNYYYYPSATLGVNDYNWNNASNTAKTTWLAYQNPPFVVPFDFTITECWIAGYSNSSETLQLILKKGTPSSWSNSSASTTISNITSGTYLSNTAWTANRRNKRGNFSLNVSTSTGDILVPQLRKSTNNNSTTRYFYGVFCIVGEKT